MGHLESPINLIPGSACLWAVGGGAEPRPAVRHHKKVKPQQEIWESAEVVSPVLTKETNGSGMTSLKQNLTLVCVRFYFSDSPAVQSLLLLYLSLLMTHCVLLTF